MYLYIFANFQFNNNNNNDNNNDSDTNNGICLNCIQCFKLTLHLEMCTLVLRLCVDLRYSEPYQTCNMELLRE